MNREQIFTDAVKKCSGVIDRKFITQIIVEDKTNTIRKYLNSNGIVQLAYHLQETAKNVLQMNLDILVDDIYDERQKRYSKPRKNKSTTPPVRLYTNKPVAWKGYTTTSYQALDETVISMYNHTYTVDGNLQPTPPQTDITFTTEDSDEI